MKQEEICKITLLSDTVFKYMYKFPLFNQKINACIKKYTNIDLVDYKDNDLNDKEFILSKDNHDVVIEMQQAKSARELKTYAYLYRITRSNLESDTDYHKKKTTIIRFNNFLPIDINDKSLVSFYSMNPKYGILNRELDSYDLNLPNFHEKDYTECDDLEKFLWIFPCEIDEMKNVVDNEEDMQIVEELERLSMNEDFINEYHNEIIEKNLLNSNKNDGYDEGFDDGYEIGHQEGVLEGVQDEKRRVIKELYASGVSIDIISESVNLKATTVKSILESN